MIEILDWLKRIFAVSRRLLGGVPRYFFCRSFRFVFCLLFSIFGKENFVVMRVRVIQSNTRWQDVGHNLSQLEAMIGLEVQAGELVVLPEMFSSGFCMEPQSVADRGEVLGWMQRMAARLGCAIAGSVAVEVEDGYRNRLYFVKPDGVVEYYDKSHLFAYGGETACYTAGGRRVVVEWQGVRILLLVCFDLRFPVFARCRDDYDMILCVANWPSVRMEAWNILLRARAIENQCYAVGVNRVGCDPVCEYAGGSMVVNPYGEVVASCGDEECIAVGEVDMEFVSSYREKFSAVKSGDSFRLNL